MAPPNIPVTVTVEDTQALEEEAKSFRRSRGPLLFTIMANVLLSALCLGAPYYRGRVHAKESLAAFAQFSACLFSGKVARRPGLSLPRGDRPRFANLVLSNRQDWPSTCDDSLERIAPPEAIFLWPSVKRTGSDVRKVVAMLRKDLDELGENTRRLHAIPERPLLVVAKLRAALALFAEAAGAHSDLDRDAIVIDNAGVQEEPTRLPLMAGESAPTHVWTSKGALMALSADLRGVSLLKLENGSVERARPRRTGLVRGTLVANDTPYVVWATREGRCAELDDHCASRAVGVSAMAMDDNSLPDPHWYAGHPYMRIDHSIQIAGDQLRLLARTGTPHALEVRTFEMNAPPDPKVPTAATESSVLQSTGPIVDALLPPGDDGAVFFLSQIDGGLQPHLHGEVFANLELAPVKGKHGWSQACSFGPHRLMAYGSSSEMHVLATNDGVASMPAAATPVVLGEVYDEDDPHQDLVTLACGSETALIVYRDINRQLWSMRCAYDATCEVPKKVATEVKYVAAAISGDVPVIAYSHNDFGQIEVLGYSKQTVQPGPCFTPRRGMCGQPILWSDGSLVVVIAHEASDLLVTESTDHAKSFHPLPGLAKVGSGASSLRTLQTHRVRKGIN